MNVELQTDSLFFFLEGVSLLDYEGEVEQHFVSEGTPVGTDHILNAGRVTMMRQLLSSRQGEPLHISLLSNSRLISAILLLMMSDRMGLMRSLTPSSDSSSDILEGFSISRLTRMNSSLSISCSESTTVW